MQAAVREGMTPADARMPIGTLAEMVIGRTGVVVTKIPGERLVVATDLLISPSMVRAAGK
ncbi:unnamed protein product [Ectocarpus sp. CCAP 1310/34]|nr:unnamed protein product [Ectocarpus sp. CCAP 1310/34]